MTDLIVPAPLWRRLIAGLYDALLLAGMWMCAAWALVVAASLGGWELKRVVSQGIYFGIGLFFYGWFWTHGGQTLGMRVWRLQVRRLDGAQLRWPIAVLRYSAAWFSLMILGLGFLWSLLDGQRRTWHDLLSGTEMVQLPKPPKPRNAGAD